MFTGRNQYVEIGFKGHCRTGLSFLPRPVYVYVWKKSGEAQLLSQSISQPFLFVSIFVNVLIYRAIRSGLCGWNIGR